MIFSNACIRPEQLRRQPFSRLYFRTKKRQEFVLDAPVDRRPGTSGLADLRGARKADLPVQELCGFSVTSLSLSAIRPSSGSERAFIFRIALLRWTFTVASAMPISPAICLLRRPRAT
jgi:hypothetical protein